jgi:hypothetical protein
VDDLQQERDQNNALIAQREEELADAIDQYGRAETGAGMGLPTSPGGAALIVEQIQSDINYLRDRNGDLEQQIFEQQQADRETQAAAEQASAQQAETESRMQPLIDDALNFLVDNGRIREGASLIGDRSAFASGVLTPGVSAGDVRLARAAVRELGAIAAMRSVREARAAGFGGSLSDADIALIQSSGGTFDLSEPEATVRTLQSLQAAMDSNGEAGDEDGYETVTTRFGDVRIRVRD